MYHIASTQQPPDMPENVSSEALSFLALCFQRYYLRVFLYLVAAMIR